jgi:hypothetical protein
MSDSSTGIDLSTEPAEPYTFTVDGETFNLFTFEQLSKEQEARVQALFRRHSREVRKLADSRDDREAESAAAKNRETRIDILTALTSMPRDLVEKLPQPAQARLMKEIGRRMRVEADLDDEE